MNTTPKKTPYLKSDLIAELAEVADIPKTKAEAVLNQLAQIAYREAHNGFTVPGICKLDVVKRKERRARLPHSGQWILIGAHKALRTRPLKRASHAVAPRMPGLVQYIEYEPVPEDAAPGTAPKEKMVSSTEGQPFNPEGLVSFRCGACGQEIEAPFDMAGSASQCPACNGRIEVPYVSEPSTIWGRAIPEMKPPAPSAAPTSEPTSAEGTPPLNSMPVPPPSEMQMGRTIRIELPDDI